MPSSANFVFTRHPAVKGSVLFAALYAPRIADYLRVSIGTDADMDAFLAAYADIIRVWH